MQSAIGLSIGQQELRKFPNSFIKDSWKAAVMALGVALNAYPDG